ncbi:hypothetical protein ABVK25_000351 [Lepraria finkii]|uniref:Uncharacterized protein n=1 Tax=Lepraria finkii TaxID=1340010 RepID=A0ABR4BQD5_9LECA
MKDASSISKQPEKDTIQSKASQTPEKATAELGWSASEDVTKELRNKLDKAATAQKESEDKTKRLHRELHKAVTTQRELRDTVSGLKSDNRELRAVQTRIQGEANKKYQNLTSLYTRATTLLEPRYGWSRRYKEGMAVTSTKF